MSLSQRVGISSSRGKNSCIPGSGGRHCPITRAPLISLATYVVMSWRPGTGKSVSESVTRAYPRLKGRERAGADSDLSFNFDLINLKASECQATDRYPSVIDTKRCSRSGLTTIRIELALSLRIALRKKTVLVALRWVGSLNDGETG